MDQFTHTASQPSNPPRTPVPAGACDCHTHVFGPYDRFPLSPSRSYSPVAAPLPELAALQQALGLTRVVIVQPSVYGFDNRCTIASLQALGGRARGIAVIEPGIGAGALQELNAAGIRGIRLNFMTEGTPTPALAAETLRRMADLVGPLGWHLQLYCALATTAALAGTINGLGIPVVLDHFAWPNTNEVPGTTHWDVLLGLVRSGAAWVKLSGQHRLRERGILDASIKKLVHSLVAANPNRAVWGTDWPHPGAFVAQEAGIVSPLHDIDDAGDFDRIADYVGDPEILRRILVDTPARLYDFEGE